MTGSRYDLRNATMVDLIVKAYDVTADKVLEGRLGWNTTASISAR